MFSKRLFALVGIVVSVHAWCCTSNAQGLPTPPARYGHSAVYDPIRQRMVVFAGNDGFDYLFNDCWSVPLTDTTIWTRLSPTGTLPRGRSFQSAVFDPVRNRLLVFGGTGATGNLDELWELSLSGPPAWTKLDPVGPPPSPRAYQSAIYDPVQDRMLVFGGIDDTGPLNEVWALSLGSTPAWTPLPVTGSPPSQRLLQSAVFDSRRNRMVVFGGSTLFTYFDDCWALTLSSGSGDWAMITTTGTPPLKRNGHAAIYDPIGDRMMIFCGWGINQAPRNDVWTLNFSGSPTWTELAPSGTVPNERTIASAILDAPRNRMIVFGGVGDGELPCFDDVWSLPLLQSPAWTQLVPGTETPWETDPTSFLLAPTPNPCSGSLKVRYTVAKTGRVLLGVYDLSGRLIRKLLEGEHTEGVDEATWDGSKESGSPVESGVYFLRMTAPGFEGTRRVLLIR